MIKRKREGSAFKDMSCPMEIFLPWGMEETNKDQFMMLYNDVLYYHFFIPMISLASSGVAISRPIISAIFTAHSTSS